MKKTSQKNQTTGKAAQSSFFSKEQRHAFFGNTTVDKPATGTVQAKSKDTSPDETNGGEEHSSTGSESLGNAGASIQKKPIFESNQEPGEEEVVQKKCAGCEKEEEEEVQAKGGDASAESSPATITRQLGKGNSLQGGTRSRMETAFGTGFSNVEIHSDWNAAGLSGKMNARAFTVGNHIAFGSGEYDPGTVSGEALLAHELAHVVQQDEGKTDGLQSKGAATYNSLEADADHAAEGAILSAWGKGGRSAKKIMPKLKSGLRIQRCASAQKKVVTPTKDAEQMKLIRRFRSERLEGRDKQLGDAGDLLAQVGDWSETEKSKQNMPEGIGVVGLAAPQMANAVKALGILKANRSLYDVKGLANVVSKLQDASRKARGAKKYIDSPNHQGELRLEFIHAGESLDEAEASLETMRDSVDGFPLYQDIEKARETLDNAKEGKIDRIDGIDYFVDQVKAINAKIHQVEATYGSRPQSIDRIAFVVQYFIAINAKDHAGQPSAAEMKRFRGSLSGSLSMDMHDVFGEGRDSSFELFIRFGNMLDKQLAVREAMAKAGLPDTMIPSQKEIGKYFESLTKKSNAEVIKAYQDYAQAFFFHRIVTNLDDMNLSDAGQIFSRPTSITAARPLVCSGYAILGGSLIHKAGGKIVRFTSGVRATDADVLGDTFATGHALTEISRQGKRLWVSNDIIEFSQADAMSPLGDAGTLYTGSGSSNKAGLDALKQKLIDKKAALQKGKRK